MRRDTASVDGFVPRNKGSRLGEHSPNRRQLGRVDVRQQIGQSSNPLIKPAEPAVAARRLPPISRSEIDDSLKDIDDDKAQGVSKRRRGLFRRNKVDKPVKSRRRKIIKRIILLLVLIGLGIGIYMGIHAFMATSSVFKGSVFGFLENKPLKTDENGRTNVLILGTTDDDPNHDGNYLTDTMMVVSLDQKNKNADIFSIPRDLWVNYNLTTCSAGYSGKINAYFQCSDEGDTPEAEQSRLTKTQAFVGNILGINIQYGVHVNSVVVSDAVNAVGGIDVNIESSDPRGILDRNFDGQCNYTCYWVKYTNGVHHLDGQHAMYLSMARGDTAPTYGLGNSNFDREINQQKVLMALKTKAASAGTLLDFGKVTALMDTMGKNLRTNFDTSEIRTLMKLGQDIQDSNIQRLNFLYGDKPVVTTGNINGQSVVVPVAGEYDYSGIQAYIQKNLYANDITREAAPVMLYNGGATAGYAADQGAVLEKKGYVVQDTDNAPTSDYKGVTIYDLTGGKKNATLAGLEKLYGVKVTKGTSPITPPEGVAFVVIFGAEQTNSSGN